MVGMGQQVCRAWNGIRLELNNRYTKPGSRRDPQDRRRLRIAPITARVVYVYPVERIGEPVGIAFPAHFPVRHDIDTGPMLVFERQHGGIVLRFLQGFRRYLPQRL